MRLIKLGLISIVFLFIVATLISLLMPSHIRISRAVNVHAPKDSIMALVSNRERWPEWHPAFMQSNPKKFAPITSTITARTDTSVVMELRQGDKRPVANGWTIYGNDALADSITVQWYMDFHLQWYPWQKLGSLFFENTYGSMMEQGLGNIRKIAGTKQEN